MTTFALNLQTRLLIGCNLTWQPRGLFFCMWRCSVIFSLTRSDAADWPAEEPIPSSWTKHLLSQNSKALECSLPKWWVNSFSQGCSKPFPFNFLPVRTFQKIYPKKKGLFASLFFAVPSFIVFIFNLVVFLAKWNEIQTVFLNLSQLYSLSSGTQFMWSFNNYLFHTKLGISLKLTNLASRHIA